MRCLVIADDLTGANDTGSAFATRGYPTRVVRSNQPTAEGNESAVTVVNTDSRYVDEAVARSRVERALEGNSPDTRYKKVDSTLRGNLVAEIEAAIDAAGADSAVIAPAFPSAGRTTVGGYHLVDGTPVTETEAGHDRMGPDTAHLPSLLERSSYPVEHCSVDVVADESRLRDRFDRVAANRDPSLLVCDATTDAHLSTIARAADESALIPVYTGSAGLAEHVRLGPASSVLGVVGSVAPETIEQLAALPAESVVELDPEAVIHDPDSETDRAVEAVGDRYGETDWVVVTAATGVADVTAARDAGREQGLDESETATRISDALGTVARGVHERMGLQGLFVTGGAVATATFDALDVETFELTGTQIAAGVPVAEAEGGPADGLVCVTKAGAFGDDMAILNALHSLTGYHVPDSSRRRDDG
ncbi:four-carbon acid sugar kinase family protein [Halovenus marina]|uniref:four-carbon acid sugar kinase family protein n=1 Tax=Halovenus marina TaxID=3396621 RepID=UPI003F547AAE